MAFALENHHSSLLRFCNAFVLEMQNQNQNLTVVDYEAHADVETLPKSDLIGVANFAIEQDEHLYNIEAMIGITTYDDHNLFRLKKMTSILFERLAPTNIIEVVDADTAEPIGLMTIKKGTRAMPVAGSAQRPMRFIIFRCISSLTVGASA